LAKAACPVKLSTLFITLPLGLIAIVLAVANRGDVTVSLDPFSSTDPALGFEMPLFVALFGAVFLGMIFGAIAMWLSLGSSRAKARRVRRENRSLRKNLRQHDEDDTKSGPETVGPVGL
jgi:uncharacterized integral membrane protein